MNDKLLTEMIELQRKTCKLLLDIAVNTSHPNENRDEIREEIKTRHRIVENKQ